MDMAHKILVVDDSAGTRAKVISTLSPLGFELMEAADGAEALETLDGCAGVGLVLLDINMPRMDGLEMLKLMREREPLLGIPVVMMTTEASPAYMRRARELGAKAWLTKPLSDVVLQKAVKALLQ